MVAVGGAKGVVHIDGAVGGELLGHGGLLGLHFVLGGLGFLVGHAFRLRLAFLGLVEAGVFEHEDFDRLQGCCGFVGGHAVRREGNGLAQDFRQVVGDGLQTEFGFVAFAFRTAQVAHQDKRGSLADDVFDGGQGGLDAGVVRDDAIFQRDVEVNAHDNFFAFQGDVFDGLFVHVFSLLS